MPSGVYIHICAKCGTGIKMGNLKCLKTDENNRLYYHEKCLPKPPVPCTVCKKSIIGRRSMLYCSQECSDTMKKGYSMPVEIIKVIDENTIICQTKKQR